MTFYKEKFFEATFDFQPVLYIFLTCMISLLESFEPFFVLENYTLGVEYAYTCGAHSSSWLLIDFIDERISSINVLSGIPNFSSHKSIDSLFAPLANDFSFIRFLINSLVKGSNFLSG